MRIFKVMPFAYTIFSLGDAALTIDFGNTIDEAVNKNVLRLFRKLQHRSPHILDVIPAYSSLTICYNSVALRSTQRTAFETVKGLIGPLLREEENNIDIQPRRIEIPVCYARPFALDIVELAAQKAMSVEEVIHVHTTTIYRVYTIGFLPGFAYMGSVDKSIATPRRAEPRSNVPASSVGIAGAQTGIYPLASPGGWNIIGRTPLKLFDAAKEDSVLLRPGDEVSFYSITRDAFENYQSRTA